MTITAKFPGTCSKCSRRISVGEKIEWSKGQKAYHSTCPAHADADPEQPKAPKVRTNGKPGECDRCGDYLKVGEGRLQFCAEDSGCMRHHDFSGWHVYCLDTSACEARRAEKKARIQEELNREQRVKDAHKIVAALPKIESAPEWSASAQPIESPNPIMPHTGAYPQIKIHGDEVYYHVPGYFACDWDYAETRRGGPLGPEIQKAIEILKTEGGWK